MLRRALVLVLPFIGLGCSESSTWDPSPRVAPSGETRIKIAAWNIEWLADEDGQGNVPRQQEDYDRLKGYADRLDADIIALAEVEGLAGVSRVFDPALYDIHIADNDWIQRTGFAYRKGLGITVEPDYYDLSLGGSLRSGAVLRLDTATQSVRFMAVHLKASCPSGPLDASSDCETLAAQVPFLEEWIDEQADQEIPFVVLGDFNRRFFATSNEEIWAEIDDAQPANADLFSPTEDEDVDCWSWNEYIDHIVMDRQVTDWYVDGSFGQQSFDASDSSYEDVLSDHCPIYSELLVPGGGDDSGDADDSGDDSGDDLGDDSGADSAGDDSSDGADADGGSSGGGDEDDAGDSEEDGSEDSSDGGSSDGGSSDGGSEDEDEDDDRGDSAGDDLGTGDGSDSGGADASGGDNADSMTSGGDVGSGDGTPPPGSGHETFGAEASCACRTGKDSHAWLFVGALLLWSRRRRDAAGW